MNIKYLFLSNMYQWVTGVPDFHEQAVFETQNSRTKMAILMRVF